MNIEQARERLRAWTGRGRSREEPPGGSLFDNYWSTPEDQRQPFVDVMGLLLREGDEGEQDLAANFLWNVPVPESAVSRLVDAYCQEAPGGPTPLGRFLGTQMGIAIKDTDVRRLKALFLADPVAHRQLAQTLLDKDGSDEVWAAMGRMVDQLDEPRALRDVWSAANYVDRGDDFFDLMAGRPLELVYELAEWLPDEFANRLVDRLDPPARRDSND